MTPIDEVRLDGVRRWRDFTRDRYEGMAPKPEDPVTSNARGWWRDVDALLRLVDELAAVRSLPVERRMEAMGMVPLESVAGFWFDEGAGFPAWREADIVLPDWYR